MSNLVKRAEIWCKKWHGEQERKYTGAPYWTHPFAVRDLGATVPHTDAMLCAALMHDLLEDTRCTEQDIRYNFTNEITDLVCWLTDVSKPQDGNRKERKALDLIHLQLAPPAVKTVKLADLIDNSKSIRKYDPEFAIVYLKEKRLLLDEALRNGDPTLWAMADQIVRVGL